MVAVLEINYFNSIQFSSKFIVTKKDLGSALGTKRNGRYDIKAEKKRRIRK